ncbi:platelet-activating factor acetylhydrolase [Astrocystis sublimbata]|nr:platelet-activating factor acetylhydrolase [Astrocystis sublimbata]
MLQSVLISLGLAIGARAQLLVPDLTGPHKVGTTVLELIDHARQDPFSPKSEPRDLVVSLFYPTTKHIHNCTLAPQFPPITAATLDAQLNAPGVAETVTTRACAGSPLTRPDLPLVLLTPGLGNPRLFHSDTAAELASYGYNVVTVDHPYEPFIVEYPDGRAVSSEESPKQANATLQQNLDARVKDLRFVLDSLADSSVTSQIPGLKPHSSSSAYKTQCAKTGFKTDKVGVFGHSFGGATALQLLKDDARFAVGANLDGALWGDVVQKGTDSPFLIFGRRFEDQYHNRKGDETWAEAWKHLGGFKQQYNVNGTQHADFTDVPVLADLLPPGALGAIGQQLGSIKGSRILEIETAYLTALFDRFLKGKGGELLDGKGAERFPEVALFE